MTPLVVATHNPKKAGEMVRILSLALPDRRLLTLADYPGAPEPDETGATYEANALIKVRSAVLATGEECVADDAGLEIDALDGAPGVLSKRFLGADLPWPEKNARVLEMLSGVPPGRRDARFRCWVALGAPQGGSEGEERTFEGVLEGRIAPAASGAGGFGYDPIFLLPDGRTLADLAPDEKHRVSHRGRVLAKLVAHLRAKDPPESSLDTLSSPSPENVEA